MTGDSGLPAYFDACAAAGVRTSGPDHAALAPACSTEIPESGQWAVAVQIAKQLAMRWCAFWSSQSSAAGFEAFTCLESQGRYLVLRARFRADAELPSLAGIYPAANRPERHAHDLLGVRYAGQPDARRWVRHRAWDEKDHPLQTVYHRPAPGPAPADDGYPFHTAQGAGVVEIPVGPVHAGIIEPGHFRFQAVGETVLNLEERLGYVHKGIEKIAVGRDAAGLARLAGRVSGDSTVAHAWAACQALERAAGVEVPPRALHLRAIMAERERVANHLGDIAAICNDVAFTFAYYQLTRIKEDWLRESDSLFGHRFMMDRIIPGGVAADPGAAAVNAMAERCLLLKEQIEDLITVFEGSESLEDRLMTAGRLSPEQAAMLGAVGYVGKASGQSFDVRRAAPYAPYDSLTVTVPTYRAGDVAARAKIRADEIGISLDLIRELAARLPAGSCRANWPEPLPHEREGIGFVEGWRGEIITYLKLGADGRVLRFYPRDPSWLTWPALELLIQDNIVPDFPVCNKSVNGSYSGQDL
jgi:Ni,Fe-hydrogenase III large subunit/NADH:ubiquinone oxidoreductase subunit C